MAAGLTPIPQGVAITDRAGVLTEFFRLRWQELIDRFLVTPNITAPTSKTGQTASIAATAAFTTRTAGKYRVSYVMHKTVADGVSSSLTMTIGWVRGGISLSQAFAALTTDTTAAQQNGVVVMNADGVTDITYAITYASNTPAKMTYELDVVVEQFAG